MKFKKTLKSAIFNTLLILPSAVYACDGGNIPNIDLNVCISLDSTPIPSTATYQFSGKNISMNQGYFDGSSMGISDKKLPNPNGGISCFRIGNTTNAFFGGGDCGAKTACAGTWNIAYSSSAPDYKSGSAEFFVSLTDPSKTDVNGGRSIIQIQNRTDNAKVCMSPNKCDALSQSFAASSDPANPTPVYIIFSPGKQNTSLNQMVKANLKQAPKK